MTEFPALTLVIGGAASGKSDFAERLVIASGKARIYIATAQAFDAEMEAKIARHKALRAAHDWTTIEAPTDLAGEMSRVPSGQAVLIDCATLWLSNLLLSEADIEAETDRLMDVLAKASQPVVIVTNEVGQGVVPDNAMGRRFTAIQGRFNQRLAAQAELAVQVVAGLPNTLKGTLPEGMT